jgi:hypothetical protein
LIEQEGASAFGGTEVTIYIEFVVVFVFWYEYRGAIETGVAPKAVRYFIGR